MKNKLLLSALLAGICLTSSANAYFDHTITGGYAKTNFNFDSQGVHPKGVNLKYHLSDSENPIGFISSLSYTKGEEDYHYYGNTFNRKLYYYSFLVGPSYTFADTVRVYAMGGVSRTGVKESYAGFYAHERRTDFAYGAGLQFLIAKSFVIDAGYEHTRYGDSVGKVEADTFTFGLGWQF